MTAYKVLEDFRLFIEDTVKEIRLGTKEGNEKSPQVVLGYLDEPEDDKEARQEFPYILIRYIKDQTTEEESILNLKLLFGAFSKDNKGWIDLLHLIERVESAILRKQVFDFYTINFPIKASIPEEQPYPYFIGLMELEFIIPKVQYEGDEKEWLQQ